MQLNYKLDLSRYNLVELEVFVQLGILTAKEMDDERKARGLEYDTITPPDSRRPE